MALQQGIGGVVRVRVALDRIGAVRDVVVVSTPSRILVPETLRAARASTFAPARRRCAGVASSYEFRVLYDDDRERESPPPGPTPSPSPTPLPVPNYAQPWKLTWSGMGTYSDTERTISSARSYTRVDDTFPISHRKACRTTLSPAVFGRVTALLRAARAESWLAWYNVGTPWRPSPTPVPRPTPRPEVDVIALVRGETIVPHVMDGGSGHLTLTTGGITYQTGFDFGNTPAAAEPGSAAAYDLMRAFDAADADCMRRRR